MKSKSYIILVVISLILVGIIVWIAAAIPQNERRNFSSPVNLYGNKIKSPLTAKVIASRSGTRVTFSLNLRDADNKEIKYLVLPSGKRPAAPIVNVLDSQGNRVYKCTLEYG